MKERTSPSDQLARVRASLIRRAAEQAAAERARQVAERKAQAERDLFAATVGPVRPIPERARRATLSREQPAPIARQQERDQVAVLRESLSDEFDVESLLDTDDGLSFRRSGIGTDVTRKLRRGVWAVQGFVDLHGLRREEARAALADFIRQSGRKGWRCVRVIHGKGLGSPGKSPVLKSRVQSWLVQKKEVLAFVQAQPTQGGAGALLVLLSAAPPLTR